MFYICKGVLLGQPCSDLSSKICYRKSKATELNSLWKHWIQSLSSSLGIRIRTPCTELSLLIPKMNLTSYSWNCLAVSWALPAYCRTVPYGAAIWEICLLFVFPRMKEFWLLDHVSKFHNNLCREIRRMKTSGLPWQRAASMLTYRQCVVCISLLTASLPIRREHISSTQTEIWWHQYLSETSPRSLFPLGIQSRLPTFTESASAQGVLLII